MADKPTIKTASVVFKYSTTSGFRAEFTAKADGKIRNTRTGELVPPLNTLVASIRELTRVACVGGFESEALTAAHEAAKAVRDWRDDDDGTPAEDRPKTDKVVPPDPDNMNDDRADWAHMALLRFMTQTGTDSCDALSDLLCDLMHLCDRTNEDGFDFDDQLARARVAYEAETTAEP